MKHILFLLAVLILLAGCTFTGRVVEEVEKQQTQEEKDQISLEQAVADKDVSLCYGIQTQQSREECFVLVAKELKDPSICKNLLGKSLRNVCNTLASESS